MPSPVRTVLAIAAWTALLTGTALLLDRLAQWQFTAHLRDQAAHALVLAANGDTPYRWRFRNPDDLIAGHVFEADHYNFENDELVVRSSGAAFEIGLPLSRQVDLQLFPHLQIDAEANAPVSMRVVVRQSLGDIELAAATTDLGVGVTAISMDLGKSHWAGAAQVVDIPRVAAMLRLRVQMAAGKELHLRSVVLGRGAGARHIDLGKSPQVADPGTAVATAIAVYRLPYRQETQKVDIAAIEKNTDAREPVLILLPQRGRVEQQIALRNAVFAALPAAILIPEAALDASFAQARIEAAAAPASSVEPISRWLLLALYAALLGYFRLRPPHRSRQRALAEIALAMAAPLWLILGGNFDGNPDPWQEALIAASMIYAISLSVPRSWQWNGSARAWLLASGVVMLAGLLGLVMHRTETARHALSLGHSARYLVWALLQQYLICAVCTQRWRIVTGSTAIAVYLGALGFALLHMPNAALMLATFVGGLCWCALYLRERALLPLAFSHAASALLLLALLPRDILSSAEVSVRFFQ